ncbi:hypothetical protein MPSEU_000647800 [Mayamaea pseudoterrestris]|nr:hypothetical protein MPSEU_000647800 [Mayamaea pseudoterrestris]
MSTRNTSELHRNECSICLLHLSTGKTLACLPCGHVFHEKCYRRYVRKTPSDNDGFYECCICRQTVTSSGRIHVDLGDSYLHEDEFFQPILQALASSTRQTVQDALDSLECMLVDDSFVANLLNSSYLSTVFSIIKQHRDDAQIALRFAQVMLRLCGVSVDALGALQPLPAAAEASTLSLSRPSDVSLPKSDSTTLANLDGPSISGRTIMTNAFSATSQLSASSTAIVSNQVESVPTVPALLLGTHPGDQDDGVLRQVPSIGTLELDPSPDATLRPSRFTPTPVCEGNGFISMQSITAMPAYEDSSFEEIRLRDNGIGFMPENDRIQTSDSGPSARPQPRQQTSSVHDIASVQPHTTETKISPRVWQSPWQSPSVAATVRHQKYSFEERRLQHYDRNMVHLSSPAAFGASDCDTNDSAAKTVINRRQPFTGGKLPMQQDNCCGGSRHGSSPILTTAATLAERLFVKGRVPLPMDARARQDLSAIVGDPTSLPTGSAGSNITQSHLQVADKNSNPTPVVFTLGTALRRTPKTRCKGRVRSGTSRINTRNARWSSESTSASNVAAHVKSSLIPPGAIFRFGLTDDTSMDPSAAWQQSFYFYFDPTKYSYTQGSGMNSSLSDVGVDGSTQTGHSAMPTASGTLASPDMNTYASPLSDTTVRMPGDQAVAASAADESAVSTAPFLDSTLAIRSALPTINEAVDALSDIYEDNCTGAQATAANGSPTEITCHMTTTPFGCADLPVVRLISRLSEAANNDFGLNEAVSRAAATFVDKDLNKMRNASSSVLVAEDLAERDLCLNLSGIAIHEPSPSHPVPSTDNKRATLNAITGASQSLFSGHDSLSRSAVETSLIGLTLTFEPPVSTSPLRSPARPQSTTSDLSGDENFGRPQEAAAIGAATTPCFIFGTAAENTLEMDTPRPFHVPDADISEQNREEAQGRFHIGQPTIPKKLTHRGQRREYERLRSARK